MSRATATKEHGRSGSWSATTPNKPNATRPSEVSSSRTLESLIVGSGSWTDRRRDEFVGSLKTKPGLRRYLRRTGGGLLRVDAAAIKRESHLDGKWLLRTSDATLTAEDLTPPTSSCCRSNAAGAT